MTSNEDAGGGLPSAVGSPDFGGDAAGEGGGIGDDRYEGAASVLVAPRGRALGGMHSHRLTSRGAGGPDMFQDRALDRIVRTGLAAE